MLLDPRRFHAGETVIWSLSPSIFSQAAQALLAEDGSSVKIGIANSGGAVAVAGSIESGVWVFSLTAAVSAGLAAGSYAYQLVAEVTEDEVVTKRLIEEAGQLEVLPLVDGSAAVDARSADERILDAIIAVMEGHASTNQASTSIDGTSISRMSWTELIQARNEFQRRVDLKRKRSRITFERF